MEKKQIINYNDSLLQDFNLFPSNDSSYYLEEIIKDILYRRKKAFEIPDDECKKEFEKIRQMCNSISFSVDPESCIDLWEYKPNEKELIIDAKKFNKKITPKDLSQFYYAMTEAVYHLLARGETNEFEISFDPINSKSFSSTLANALLNSASVYTSYNRENYLIPSINTKPKLFTALFIPMLSASFGISENELLANGITAQNGKNFTDFLISKLHNPDISQKVQELLNSINDCIDKLHSNSNYTHNGNVIANPLLMHQKINEILSHFYEIASLDISSDSREIDKFMSSDIVERYRKMMYARSNVEKCLLSVFKVLPNYFYEAGKKQTIFENQVLAIFLLNTYHRKFTDEEFELLSKHAKCGDLSTINQFLINLDISEIQNSKTSFKDFARLFVPRSSLYNKDKDFSNPWDDKTSDYLKALASDIVSCTMFKFNGDLPDAKHIYELAGITLTDSQQQALSEPVQDLSSTISSLKFYSFGQDGTVPYQNEEAAHLDIVRKIQQTYTAVLTPLKNTIDSDRAFFLNTFKKGSIHQNRIFDMSLALEQIQSEYDELVIDCQNQGIIFNKIVATHPEIPKVYDMFKKMQERLFLDYVLNKRNQTFFEESSVFDEAIENGTLTENFSSFRLMYGIRGSYEKYKTEFERKRQQYLKLEEAKNTISEKFHFTRTQKSSLPIPDFSGVSEDTSLRSSISVGFTPAVPKLTSYPPHEFEKEIQELPY